MERNRKKDVNVPLLADDMTGKDETLNLYQKTLRTDKHFQAIRIQKSTIKNSVSFLYIIDKYTEKSGGTTAFTTALKKIVKKPFE